MSLRLLEMLEVNNTLGEAVIWDTQRELIWWSDIQACKLYSYQPCKKKLEVMDTPERLCSFAPVQGKEELVAAFASGFAYYHPESQKLEWIKKIEPDNPSSRLNDGRTDRQGRFWAGTMIEDEQHSTARGALYCLHRDLSVSRHIENISISNGLCWSKDSKTLYHADSVSQRIDQYSYDPLTCSLGTRKLFSTTDNTGYPDGSIVDEDGYLWNAEWGGFRVVRYRDDGSVDQILPLEVSQPTCITFAGESLNLVVVTSATQDLDQSQLETQASAGNLFIYESDICGIAEMPFVPH